MKTIGLALTSLLLIGAFAAPSHGQSLGEAARREAERRARINGTAKVITNADLLALPARGAAAPAVPTAPATILEPRDAVETTPAASAPDAPQPAAPAVREKRDEQYWRGRAQVIRDRLNRLQSDAVALEGRRDVLRTEVDTASASQKSVLTEELRRIESRLSRVEDEVRLIQNEWRMLEEGAVQDKVPLAWIR